MTTAICRRCAIPATRRSEQKGEFDLKFNILFINGGVNKKSLPYVQNTRTAPPCRKKSFYKNFYEKFNKDKIYLKRGMETNGKK